MKKIILASAAFFALTVNAQVKLTKSDGSSVTLPGVSLGMVKVDDYNFNQTIADISNGKLTIYSVNWNRSKDNFFSINGFQTDIAKIRTESGILTLNEPLGCVAPAKSIMINTNENKEVSMVITSTSTGKIEKTIPIDQKYIVVSSESQKSIDNLIAGIKSGGFKGTTKQETNTNEETVAAPVKTNNSGDSKKTTPKEVEKIKIEFQNKGNEDIYLIFENNKGNQGTGRVGKGQISSYYFIPGAVVKLKKGGSVVYTVAAGTKNNTRVQL
jgi:hypothetical protein